MSCIPTWTWQRLTKEIRLNQCLDTPKYPDYSRCLSKKGIPCFSWLWLTVVMYSSYFFWVVYLIEVRDPRWETRSSIKVALACLRDEFSASASTDYSQKHGVKFPRNAGESCRQVHPVMKHQFSQFYTWNKLHLDKCGLIRPLEIYICITCT